jgi:hypothetical protein
MPSPNPAKSLPAKSISGKDSILGDYQPNLGSTEVESFLRSVKTTARGPILDEINGYFKNNLKEFENFIHGRSDKI